MLHFALHTSPAGTVARVTDYGLCIDTLMVGPATDAHVASVACGDASTRARTEPALMRAVAIELERVAAELRALAD